MNRERTRRPPAAEAAFRPPYCPHRNCRYHRAGDRALASWRFARRGYRRVRRPPGLIRRFRCRACGGWFSSSTFREDYWRKLPGLSGPVYRLITDGKGLRQAARTLGVSPTTVRNRQRWLARQALLVQLEQRRRLGGRLAEPVVLDGIRSFAGSQHEPAELNTTAGARSGYVYDLQAIPLRRSGTMTPAQKKERARREGLLGRPDPQARRKAVKRALRAIGSLLPPGATLDLRTDEDTSYPLAIRDVAGRLPVRHTTVSSKRRRDERNPLWRVNHLHRVMRHSLANLKRETIAHSKRLAGLMDRTVLHACWLNNTKGVSERRLPDSVTTPAMRLGLEPAAVSGESLFARRRFAGRVGLPAALRLLYEGRLKARPREPVTLRVPVYSY